ncbi:MAG TPA: hypothetical protein VIL09_00235 [Microvirga sp.]|jgi:hypothetical protein
MKRQTRPFAVEIKRSKSPLSDEQERTVPAPARDPDAARLDQKSEMADGGLAQALEMAAQVFGAPRPPTQPAEPRQPEADELIVGSSPEPIAPQSARLLPDLLALAREERAAIDRSPRRTSTKRQATDASPQGETIPRERKAVRKPFRAPEVIIADSRHDDVGESVRPEAIPPQTDGTHAMTARLRTSGTQRNAATSTQGVPARASARARSALRKWNGSSRSELPRGERWKERRLPRVCWKRPKNRQS